MVKDMVRIGVMMACLVSCLGYAAGEQKPFSLESEEDSDTVNEQQESGTRGRQRVRDIEFARRNVPLYPDEEMFLNVCQNGDLQKIQSFVKKNQGFSCGCAAQSIALMYATNKGHQDIVAFLHNFFAGESEE